MLYTASGSLPRHLYVFVDGRFMGCDGWHSAVWFGLHAHPGRMWGCTVMLECGAVYRNLPPHALAWTREPPEWMPEQAQIWDCYGHNFSTHIYSYLDGLDAWARIDGKDVPCSYLFTAVPIGDAFTHEPEQEKEFMFLKTDHGRLTIQPTNRCRFIESSFTDAGSEMPKLCTQTETYSCER